MRRRRTAAALVGLALVAVVTGCTTLPTYGPVHTRADSASSTDTAVTYFVPPGPGAGDDPQTIVRGFLLAMQANPPGTAVAREFLTDRARTTWRPVDGTVVYDTTTIAGSGSQVEVALHGVHTLDGRGAWQGGSSSATSTFGLSLVRERGQWRIDDPPDALAVESSDFASLFVPFDLYFFDRTGTVLVPTRVFVPRGEQTASNLVRGLLQGPPAADSGAVVSALPAGTDLDLGVSVSDTGLAEIPLNTKVLRLAQPDLERAVLQLAWTLRQVPGVTRVGITVDGTPVTLPSGGTDASVTDGPDLNPLTSPGGGLVGLVGGRVVRITDEGVSAVGGPFGRDGFALRSIAASARDATFAGVAASGHRLFVAPDHGATTSDQVQVPIDNAGALLRPAYDRFGGLWDVDASAHGAVVHLVQNGRDAVVAVPGLSGRRVVAFALTRDGTRLVAALADSGGTQRLLVSALVRDADGTLLRALPARLVDLPDTTSGTLRDLAQDGGTTVAALTVDPDGRGHVTEVELDGSPGDSTASFPDPAAVAMAAIAASPDPALATVLIAAADGRVYRFGGPGEWTRSTVTGVSALNYPQ